MDVKELGEKLNSLKSSIRNILEDTGKLKYDEIEVTSDKSNPEEQFLLDQYKEIVRSLSNAYSTLKYLEKPISREGTLAKNESGRYEIDYYTEFTSGSSIEFLNYDKYDECEKWIAARVEHTDGDYYIYGYKNVKLEGLKVRTRR